MTAWHETRPLWFLKACDWFWLAWIHVLPTGWLWDTARWDYAKNPDGPMNWQAWLWLLVHANAYGFEERWHMKRDGGA